MSRAFVKEDDGAPEPPPRDRPVSTAPNRVTRRGARLIKATIAALNDKLAGAADDDADAIRRDLRYWHARRANMHVVAPPALPTLAAFATRITIRCGAVTSEVTIVGEDEADPAAGLIAWTAPLARALDGAQAGDVVELAAAGRLEPIEVITIAADTRE